MEYQAHQNLIRDQIAFVPSSALESRKPNLRVVIPDEMSYPSLVTPSSPTTPSIEPFFPAGIISDVKSCVTPMPQQELYQESSVMPQRPPPLDFSVLQVQPSQLTKAPAKKNVVHDNNQTLDIAAHDLLQLMKNTISDEKFTDTQNVHLQTIANLVLSRCASDGKINLKYFDAANRRMSASYVRLPSKRSCKSESKKLSQQRYINLKAGTINDYIKWILASDDGFGDDIKGMVVKRVAKDYDYVVFKKSEVKLAIQEVVTLRDLSMMSTSSFYRFKSGFEALIPILTGMVFPASIKTKLAEFEGSGNLEIESKLHPLIVTKENKQRKPLAYMHVKNPHQVAEIMKDQSIMDGSYQESSEFMHKNHAGKDAYTLNIDKGGNDINVSIRLVNRKEGNSEKHTHPIAMVEGPVCECYENERLTIFNPDYPTGDFLQGLVDDSYLMLTVITQDQKKCQSIMFKPIPSHQACEHRMLIVGLLEDTILETRVEFDHESALNGGPPEISVPLEERKLFVRLVCSNEHTQSAIGIQFLVGSKVVRTHRFRSCLSLSDCSVENIKIDLHQVVGFPSNDGKQQIILSGISSVSCLCACPVCTCEKVNFGQLSERLWQRKLDAGLVESECPHKDAPKRVGAMASDECATRFKELGKDGGIQFTADQQREINIKCASVSMPPLLRIHVKKGNLGEPLHISMGVMNHLLDNVRKEIRAAEETAEFMEHILKIRDDVQKLLCQLSTSSKKNSEISSFVLPIHKANMSYRSKMTKLNNKIHNLEAEIKDAEELKISLALKGKLHEENESAINESIAKYREQSGKLQEEHDKVLGQWQLHTETSKYSHYIQLHAGLDDFNQALIKFLSKTSKRPQGRLEFVFNNACEHIGGGQYMAEHSGFKQTNGRALNTLENFRQIKEVCIDVCDPSSPIYGKMKDRFECYEKLATHTFALMTYIKSQKTLCLQKFELLLLNFISAWDEVFPNVPYFNKLHHLMMHVADFIDEYLIYGRLSAESHESVHSKLARVKGLVCKMTSTKKRLNTLHARSSANFKNGVLECKQKTEKKMTGKKRGKYNISKANKKFGNIDFDSFILDTVTVDDEEFICLQDGGRLPIKYEEIFVYVKTGRAPNEWVTSFEKMKCLSQEKLQQVRHATH